MTKHCKNVIQYPNFYKRSQRAWLFKIINSIYYGLLELPTTFIRGFFWGGDI
jgi:hypothetical protein